MFRQHQIQVVRADIIELLNSYSNYPVVFLCSPAGYGKTTAINQWLNTLKTANAILPIDQYDNKPSHFCSRFCNTLYQCQPSNTLLGEISSHPAFESAPEEFTIRALGSLDTTVPAVIVIDDLHVITEPSIINFLPILLKRLPENFRVVLLSRSELPPSFSQFWLSDGIARISLEQLRFSPNEIQSLYKQRGFDIDINESKELFAKTNGWAIGLNALLISDTPSKGSRLANDYLEEFLKTHVWSTWDKEKQDFMLQTSVVTDLTPELCDALTGKTNSALILYNFLKGNAFLSQVEDNHYMFHQLFHTFLVHMAESMDADFVKSQTILAAEWFLKQQDFYNAVEYFSKVKSYDGIARCFDLLEDMSRNKFVIDKVLSVIHSPIVMEAAEHFPFIYFMLGWAAFAEGRINDLERHTDCYYARYPEVVARNPEFAHNIVFLYFMDYRVNLINLLGAADKLPDTSASGGAAGSITMNMPLVHHCTRDFSELAERDYVSEVKLLEAAVGSLFAKEKTLLSFCLSAGLSYELGDLDTAYGHALAAYAEMKPDFAPESKFCAFSIMIHVLDALGQTLKADSIAEQLLEFVENERAFYLSYNLSAMLTRRALLKREHDASEIWLKKYYLPTAELLDFYRLYGHLTTCRVLIATGDYDSALILALKIITLSKQYNRTIETIEAEMLLAIAYCKKGINFQAKALSALENALKNAYKYKFTQIFITESANLLTILHRLQNRSAKQAENSDLPASFIKKIYMNALQHSKNTGGNVLQKTSADFTEKQKKVMRLLCEGKSYKEIAEILNIKFSTVRSHIELIYRKLDVSTVTEAVIRINESRILDEN